MLIIRFDDGNGTVRLGAATDEGEVFDLPHADFVALADEAKALGLGLLERIRQIIDGCSPRKEKLDGLRLLAPIEAREIWAAGVTYERSREARNYEATRKREGTDTFYDKVYHAARPELFLKSGPLRTVGPDEELCLRSDSSWLVPEPELGLVLDRDGRILGYTIGNDMSSRDIEGENPLYLPQAKVWRRSCSIGPAIRLAETVADPYGLTIELRIHRGGEAVVEGSVSTGQLKRKLDDLVSYLIRDNDIYDGTILLTGTGIVPPDDFSLQSGDRVDISIAEIGRLSNPIR